MDQAGGVMMADAGASLEELVAVGKGMERD